MTQKIIAEKVFEALQRPDRAIENHHPTGMLNVGLASRFSLFKGNVRMRYRVVRAGVAAALAVLVVNVVSAQQPPPQPQGDQPLFRASVRTVSIYTTVVDASGRLVPDLQRDDFIILE